MYRDGVKSGNSRIARPTWVALNIALNTESAENCPSERKMYYHPQTCSTSRRPEFHSAGLTAVPAGAQNHTQSRLSTSRFTHQPLRFWHHQLPWISLAHASLVRIERLKAC